MATSDIITIKDERTNKNYSLNICDEKYREYVLTKLKEKMDYDWFESLPAIQRINKKVKSLNFTCPHCTEMTEVNSRKEKIVNGFLFFISTTIIDVFKCCKCGKEFTEREICSKKEEVRRQNNVITNFENWKDAKKDGKNPPEFASFDKVDEVIINSF